MVQFSLISNRFASALKKYLDSLASRQSLRHDKFPLLGECHVGCFAA
jgi:hypothetical protein